LDPIKQIENKYWNLIMETRDRKEGPDGIMIWNAVHLRLREDQTKKAVVSMEHQVWALTRELLWAKIRSMDQFDEYCAWWAKRMISVTPVVFKEAVSQFREVLIKDLEKRTNGHACLTQKDSRRPISNI